MANGDKVFKETTAGMNISKMEPPRRGLSPGATTGTLGRGEHYERFQRYQRGRREAALRGKWPTPSTPKDLKK